MGRRRKKGSARKGATLPVSRAETGRVHLLIHRDGAGRTQSLSLSGDLFRAEWQNRLALAAASTTHGLLNTGRDSSALVALGRKVLGAASQVGDQALAAEGAQPVACRAGCDHCCHQSVGATPIEILTLAHFLLEQRPSEDLQKLRQRLAHFTSQTRSLSPLARHDPSLPCPLLEDGRCTAYEARPLSCRGVNSLDAERCRAALRDDDARAAYLSGSLEIPRYAEPLRAAHAVSAGLSMAASQLHELAMEPVELSWALSLALEDPEGTVSTFLEGGDPFSSARGGTATPSSHIEELTGRR